MMMNGRKNTLCIYTGYAYGPYNGKNYIERKVGGSEIAAIQIAEKLSQYFTVYVSGYFIEKEYHNGVCYIHTDYMKELLKKNEIDIMIVSRYVHFFLEQINTAKKTFIWLHDTTPNPWYDGKQIINNGYDPIYANIDSISKIICLSKFHLAKAHRYSCIFLDKLAIIGNGINNNDFSAKVERIKNRFIYISDWRRDLHNVINTFCEVVKSIPDATLHIFTDIDYKEHNDSEEWYRKESAAVLEKIKNTPSIHYHERIHHEKVITELQKSDAWLYTPSTFEETYCISALEAQRAGCICFVNDIGALKELVANRGIIFNKQIQLDQKVKIIVDTLTNESVKKEKRALMKNWAENQTWDHRAKEWVKLITAPPNNEVANSHKVANPTKYKTFCINLKRRPDRLKKFDKQMKEQNISYEIYNAIDGKSINITADPQQLFRRPDFPPPQKGKIGCTLSHVNLWKQLITDKEYDQYLILEDDIEIVADFETKLKGILSDIDQPVDWIYGGYIQYDSRDNQIKKIEHNATHSLKRRLSPWEKSRSLDKKSFYWGTQGYIITKSGVQKIFQYINQWGICVAIDSLPRFINLNIYSIEPHLLCHSDPNDTDIQSHPTDSLYNHVHPRKEKKTLCLTMIVKNEIKILKKCLDSVVDYLDYWVICDTGSTDGTQEFIKKYFAEKGIKGELHETPWKNFGFNRTLAFEKAEKKADYYFVIDADDQFVGDLNEFKNLSNNADAYLVEMRLGETRFKRQQIFSSKHKWRYVGVLHEYPATDGPNVSSHILKNCYIIDGRCGSRTTGQSQITKYAKDAEVLLQGIKDEPNNERYYFYLANSYFDCKKYEQAMIYYKKRVEMGGWAEEVYLSLHRYAVAKYIMDPNMENVVYDFLKAHNFRNTRLEALYVIVNYYRIKDPKKGYAYAMLGYDAACNYPNDILFVDDAIHKYKFIDNLAICAYYAGHHILAISLNNTILNMSDIPIDRPRIIKNKQFSIDALKDKKLLV